MKIFIDTLGCPKNEVDSGSAKALLKNGGHEICMSPEEADAIIVNTCGFINDAKRESIETIFDMASIKNDAAGEERKFLIVTGCLSKRYSGELFESMPEVDAFLGVNDYSELCEVLGKLEDSWSCEEGAVPSDKRIVLSGDAPEKYEELPVEIEEGAFSAYLRISEGCNNCCSYCAIPAIRGPYRSREPELIVSEAEQLAAQGVKEITLIAEDTTAYGCDFAEPFPLYRLLRLISQVPGIEWIRLMYCYEDSITDELIKEIAENPKVCRYIDIPLQHVSDGVLESMNRHSTSDSIRSTIRKLRDAIPDISIRTTFITGFPGETEEDHEELAEFIEETRFDRLGVFAYSPEEGTAAEKMEDQVDDDVKQRRLEELMLIQKDVSLEKNEAMVGRVVRVLVEEGPDEDGVYYGRTEFDAKEIDNGVIISSKEELVPGRFVNVEIKDAFDYDITGEVVE